MRTRAHAASATLDAVPGLDALARDYAALDALGTRTRDAARVLPSGAELLLRADERGERLILREPAGRERVLYDPASFEPERGHSYVISYFQPSWSGARVVVSLTKDGEELGEMIVLEVESGEVLPDRIGNSWPSDSGGVHWLPDDSGFVYLRHPVTDPQAPGFLHNMESVIHRIGAAPGAREVALSAAHDPTLALEPHDFPMVFIPAVDSEYAVALISGATPYAASYISPIADLIAGEPQWRPLFQVEDKVAHFAIVGDRVDVLSARRRPEYEILRTSLAAPRIEQAELLAAPPTGEVIASMAVRGEELVFVSWRDGVVANLHHRDARGGTTLVELPTSFGELTLEDGEPIPGATITGDGAVVEGGGWLSPRRRYRYSFETRALTPLGGGPGETGGATGEKSGGLDLDALDSLELDDLKFEERTVTARDGVEVPVSLIYRRDIPRDRARPTLIFGYGAYGISATPVFFPPFVLWAARGGVVAVAHVRGGGEKGEAWHRGGYKTTKANTWGDAIAVAEALQSEEWGFTSPAHTAIHGISAGGVMVGRAITERPELFAAGIAQVGTLNTARIEASANGDNSAKEFGSLDVPDECAALLEMDAYLHVREDVRYPAMLMTAGINDPRVDPWEPSKFAARLEDANAGSGGGPTLLWIDFEAGHGAGEARAALYPKAARVLGFGLWRTGHPDYQPTPISE